MQFQTLSGSSTMLLLLLLAPVSICQASSWDLSKFSTLVAFGDSYSDDARLDYFREHQGQAPPPGWVNPVNYHSADGGRPWPEYVRQYAGVRLYNYAVSGGVCSNAITPRYYDAIRGPYPSVSQYEIPAFQADSKVVNKDGSKFLIAPVDQTVYNVWVGANDIGTGGLLTDSQVLGTSIADCVDCVFAQVQKLYNLGARYFTLLNVVPLNLAPLYAMPDAGGVGPNGYWPDKPANHTAVSISMFELVVSNNQIYKYRLPFEVLVQKNFPGARFALFDVNSLFRDFYNNPSRYFNGTAPANVTGFIHHCDIHRGNCVNQPSPDSYMWYDELHLSEQTARSIASEYLNVIKGKSKYATYLSG